jgi:hypothetical protein
LKRKDKVALRLYRASFRTKKEKVLTTVLEILYFVNAQNEKKENLEGNIAPYLATREKRKKGWKDLNK